MSRSAETLAPAAFFGHGNPMNAIEVNRYSKSWREFGRSIRKPRAVLVVSAHWYTDFTGVTAMEKPRTIHDFYGFPQELFEVEYPAPGDPKLANEIAELAKPTRVTLDRDGWGIDHGAWSLLVHIFPDADVPIVQLSIDATKGYDYHFDLGMKLAELRKSDVLVICSGNIVHNLRAIDWSNENGGYEWAYAFDNAVKEIMTDRSERLSDVLNRPDYISAAPTPDHFIPLIYFAAIASASGKPAETHFEGCALGSISMTSYIAGKI